MSGLLYGFKIRGFTIKFVVDIPLLKIKKFFYPNNTDLK